MIRINKIIFAASVLILLVTASSFVFAQQEMITWIHAPLGELPPIDSYAITYYQNEDVKNQDTSLQLTKNNLLGFVPLCNRKGSLDFAVFAPIEIKNIKTDAILPNAGVKLPDNLYDVSFGPAFRYKFQNEWIGGIAFLFGSASDKLFHSSKEISARLDAYVQIPSKNDNSWILFIDYYNNREYLRNIPIPGLGYLYQPSDKLKALIGLPVAVLQCVPYENWEFEFSYIMVTNVHAKLSYNFTPNFYAFGAFDWNDELYARADRERAKDRIFYYEKLLSAGIHWQAFKYFGIELSGGYSFDRFFFEGDKYNDKDDNSIDIKNGPFASLRVGIPF